MATGPLRSELLRVHLARHIEVVDDLLRYKDVQIIVRCDLVCKRLIALGEDTVLVWMKFESLTIRRLLVVEGVRLDRLIPLLQPLAVGGWDVLVVRRLRCIDELYGA